MIARKKKKEKEKKIFTNILPFVFFIGLVWSLKNVFIFRFARIFQICTDTITSKRGALAFLPPFSYAYDIIIHKDIQFVSNPLKYFNAVKSTKTLFWNSFERYQNFLLFCNHRVANLMFGIWKLRKAIILLNQVYEHYIDPKSGGSKISGGRRTWSPLAQYLPHSCVTTVNTNN